MTGAQARVFFGLLLAFTVLTGLLADAHLNAEAGHRVRVALTTLGVITGPLTGAIAREFQRCCLTCSLSLMACCAPVLMTGVLMQYVALPDRKWTRSLRMVCWVFGWLIWFAGGILSCGHAFC